jgi:hypothetical protein
VGFEPTRQVTPPTGFRNRAEDAVTIDGNSTYAPDAVCSAFCSAFLVKNSPDLMVIVDAWASLPEAIRAGILAMVKAAKPT